MESTHSGRMTTGWRKFTFVEPPIFIIVLIYGMTGTIITDLTVYQTCRSMYSTHTNICDILHSNASSEQANHLDKIVQPHASYILLCQSLIEGILPALLSLFLGPWSDKYGRKPLLIAGSIAILCQFTLWSILSSLDVNPWIFLIVSIPSALLGGSSGIFLATYCYISDITTNDNRAWHLAWLQGCLSGGLVIGTLIGPMINEKFGYSSLFITAAVLSGLSLLHVIFWIPETVQKRLDHKWGNPFDWKLVKEMIVTSTTKRRGLNRWTLWSSIFILSLYVLVLTGHMNIGYLFANTRLGWTPVQYSDCLSISIAVAILCTIAGMKLLRYLGFSDQTQAMLGVLSGLSVAIALAFTSKPWHMFLAMSVGVFTGIIPPTTRSILSKSAPPEDIGKVFSLTMSMESLVPLGGSALYTLLYTSYMPPTYPSPVYLFSAGIYFLMLLLVILIERKINRPPNFELIIQDD